MTSSQDVENAVLALASTGYNITEISKILGIGRKRTGRILAENAEHKQNINEKIEREQAQQERLRVAEIQLRQYEKERDTLKDKVRSLHQQINVQDALKNRVRLMEYSRAREEAFAKEQMERDIEEKRRQEILRERSEKFLKTREEVAHSLLKSNQEIEEMNEEWDALMRHWENKKSFDIKEKAWIKNLRIVEYIRLTSNTSFYI